MAEYGPAARRALVALARVRRIGLLGALLSIGVALPAAAQLDSSVVGERVRLHVRDAHRQAPSLAPKRLELRGRVTTVDSGSVTVRLSASDSPLVIEREEIARVWVSRGVPGRAESALRGLVGGAVIGAFWGLVYIASPIRDSGHTWEDAVGTGALTGAATGTVLGALLPFEQWKRLKLR